MVLERQYTIPLKREVLKVPKYRRAKKAIRKVKEFLARHMKAEKEDILIGRWLNEQIWERGIKTPPNKVRVNVSKDDKGIVKVELVEISERAKKIDAKDQARIKVIDDKKKAEDAAKKAQEDAAKKAAEEKKKAEEAAKSKAEKEVDKEKKDIEKVEKQVGETPVKSQVKPQPKMVKKSHPVRQAMQK